MDRREGKGSPSAQQRARQLLAIGLLPIVLSMCTAGSATPALTPAADPNPTATGMLWAAIGICPLAANRRGPLMAISPLSMPAPGDTTASSVLPSTGTSATRGAAAVALLWGLAFAASLRLTRTDDL